MIDIDEQSRIALEQESEIAIEKALTEIDAEILGPLWDEMGSGPELDLIRELHAHADAYVPFAVSSGDDFRPLIAIHSGELLQSFPKLRDRLRKDAYVGINASYCLARHRKGPEGTPNHKTENLRYLCCCYVDLDFYKEPVLACHPGWVLIAMKYLEDTGRIPAPSIFAISGRGIWLLFLLRDARNPQCFQGAWREKVELYGQIEHALVERLKDFGADPAAVDAARYIRLPGSLHTGAEKAVIWWVNHDPAGAVPRYTLAGLAQFLHVNPQRQAWKRATTGMQSSEDARGRKRCGWIGLQRRRLRDFEKLREIRGGFYEGCRHYALLVYGWLLRCNGISKLNANSRLATLAAECHPRLRSCDVRSALKTAFEKRIQRIRDQKVSDWLDITVEESSKLEKFPSASRFCGSVGCSPANQNAAKQAKHRNTTARRALIQELIRGLGRIPPTREMRHLLEGKGCHVSHVTVSNDYKTLGVRLTNCRFALDCQADSMS